MKEFYRLFGIMSNNKDKKYALATIINVKGSSYRKEGAKMMIGLDGSSYGTISGGCLEEDLYYRAIDVLESLEPKVVTYDLMSEDDSGWGQGAGCNGIIEVYIEPFYWFYQLSTSDDSLYSLLAREMKEEKQIISVRIIASNQALNCYYTEKGNLIGNLEKVEPYFAEIDYYLESFIQGDLHFESTVIPMSNKTLIFEKYEPKEHLYIFGAGPDAEPLVEFASKLDYAITVVDPRAKRCNRRNFKLADSLIVEFPSKFFLNYQIAPDSYVIIMTHNFERDKDILKRLINIPLKYLGVLGPRRRTQRLLLPQEIPGHINSPIGLDIDAEGAEEISFSILAEMIKVRNSKVHSPV